MKKKGKDADLTDYIRVKAEELWIKDGCQQGHDLDYWREAEKIIKSQIKKEKPDSSL